MEKIMFNDRYGLTQAVLDGSKTMTRRAIKDGVIKDYLMSQWWIRQSHINNRIRRFAHYQVGDVVAIAQSYKEAKITYLDYLKATNNKGNGYAKGFENKMFVKPDLMPHHIRITNVRVERLQDISDEDCLREGIKEDWSGFIIGDTAYWDIRCAFASLIYKTCGKGTWDSNPYVFVYEFERVTKKIT